MSEADLQRAARVIALKDAEHRPLLARLHPDWEDRVEYWHVSDLDCATAGEATAEIEAHVKALLAELDEAARPSP